MASEAKQEIAKQLESMGLTMVAQFVPLSRSRNANEKSRTLNWRVTILHHGARVLTTDYSAGCAHTEAYKAPVNGPHGLGGRHCVMRDDAIRAECETGRTRSGKRVNLDIADVMYSLNAELVVLEFACFESWAAEYGYDADSRKAHAIYTGCLENALKLRAGIGQAKLDKLQELFTDY